MSDLIRKLGLFGIGVIAITQEKLEELSQEMIKKGELNREEGKKFVAEVLIEKERQLKDIEDKINKAVQDGIEKSGIAMKKDIDDFKRRIINFEERIERLEEKLDIQKSEK